MPVPAHLMYHDAGNRMVSNCPAAGVAPAKIVVAGVLVGPIATLNAVPGVPICNSTV